MKNISNFRSKKLLCLFVILIFLCISIAVLDINSKTVFASDGDAVSPFIFTKISETECDVRLSDKTVTQAIIPETTNIAGKEYVVSAVAVNGFASAARLKKVRLPKSVKIIGQSAFANCKELSSLTLPAVESIGANAFAMTKMNYLIIPKTVKTVAPTILRGTSTKVYVRAGLQDGLDFPEGTWAANWNANNTNQDVEYNSEFIPEIEYREVKHTLISDLSEISLLTDGDESVDSYIVENYQEFATVDTDEYKEVYIPSEYKGKPVVGIAAYAFNFNTIQKLVIGYSQTPINIESSAFDFYTGDIVVINRDITFNDRDWATQNEIISNNIFANSTISKLVLPDTITMFADYMFNGASISDIYFNAPESMNNEDEVKIGDNLIATNVLSLPNNDNIITIGNEVFSNLSGIKEIHIFNNVQNVGSKIFVGWDKSKDQKILIHFENENELPNYDEDTNCGWNPNWNEGCSPDVIEYNYTAEYSITYMISEGAVHNNPLTFTRKDSFVLNDATLIGYHFDGWYTNSDYTQESRVYGIQAGTQQNLILYGKLINNNYKVRYNANVPVEASNQEVYGETKDSLHIYDVEDTLATNGYRITGWYFVGWKDNAGNYYENGQSVRNLTSELNGIFVLSAQWAKNDYWVRYEENRPDSTAPVVGNMTDSKHKYDTNEILKKNEYSIIGWHFIGWNVQKDGKGMSYNDGSEISNLSSIDGATFILYAQWERNSIIIKYHPNVPANASNSVQGNMQDSVHKYDEKSNLFAHAFSLNGWDFLVWNTKADGSGTEFAKESEIYNISSEDNKIINLYAQWKNNVYTIEYVGNKPNTASNSVVGSMKISTHRYDEISSLSNIGYSLVGWKFIGWNTKSDGSGVSYKNGQNVKNLTSFNSGNIRIFAQWTPIRYSVEYYYDAGSIGGPSDVMKTEIHIYDTNYVAPKCTYTNVCWEISYWYTTVANRRQSFDVGATIKNLSVNENEIIKVYAQWTDKDFDKCLFDGKYYIATEYQFEGLVENSTKGYHFVLMSDFHFELDKGELVIGSFDGTLDGNGHRIAYRSYETDLAYVGFINFNYGIIKNLTVIPYIQEPTSSYAGHCTGGIANSNQEGALITNCIVESYQKTFMNIYTPTYTKTKKQVDILSANYYAPTGGVAGYNYGTVSNCENRASIGGQGDTGGIVGFNYKSTSKISNCTNFGYIFYELPSSILVHGAGGIVGFLRGSIDNCSNYGTVIYAVKVAQTPIAGLGQVVGLRSPQSTVTSLYGGGSVRIAQDVYLSGQQSNYVNTTHGGTVGGVYS